MTARTLVPQGVRTSSSPSVREGEKSAWTLVPLRVRTLSWPPVESALEGLSRGGRVELTREKGCRRSTSGCIRSPEGNETDSGPSWPWESKVLTEGTEGDALVIASSPAKSPRGDVIGDGPSWERASTNVTDGGRGVVDQAWKPARETWSSAYTASA